MKKCTFHRTFAAVLATAVFTMGTSVADALQTSGEVENKLLGDLPGIFERSGAHYKALLEAMKEYGPDKFPKRFQNGKLFVIPPKDWCSGFFPGALWYLYEYTNDPFWKEQAVAYTERLIEPRSLVSLRVYEGRLLEGPGRRLHRASDRAPAP